MKRNGSVISRRDFLRQASLVAAGTVVAACVPAVAGTPQAAQPAAEGVVVTQWSFPLLPPGQDDMVFFGPIVEAFEKQNPGIQVEIEIFPWQNRAQRLMSALAAGTISDVAYLNGDNYSQFADLNAMYPLDDAVADTGLKEDLKPGAIEAVTWKGKLYVAPILQTASCPYFNVTMAEAAGLDPASPPETWEQYLEWMEALTVDGTGKHPSEGGFDAASVKQWGATEALLDYGLWFLWNPWFYQAGGEFLTEDGTKSAINSDAGAAALDVLINLYDHYIDPADKGLDATTAFEEQRAASRWSVEQQYVRALRDEHPDIKFIVGNILNKERRLAHGTVAGYGVFSQSQHPADAAKWVTFLTNKENTTDFDIQLRFIPPRQSIDQQVKEAINDPEFSKAIDQSQYTRENLVHPLTQPMMKLILPHLQGAILHEKEIGAALTDAEAAVNDLLSTYTPFTE